MCIDDNVHENSSKAVTKELPSFNGKAEQLSTQLSSPTSVAIRYQQCFYRGCEVNSSMWALNDFLVDYLLWSRQSVKCQSIDEAMLKCYTVELRGAENKWIESGQQKPEEI